MLKFMRYPNEHVLVVKRSLFDQLGAFQGLSLEPDRYLQSFLDPVNNYFLERDLAEDDPSHKQIIPYAVFHHGGKFLHYVRGKKSGEQRLASKGSIGIGGHVNREDAGAQPVGWDTYMTGVAREFAEELHLPAQWEQRIVAILNDDASPVGQVHIGCVHWVDLASDHVKAAEDTIMDLQFLSLEELQQRRDSLESWSQIIVDALPALLEKK
jgi:predicted NUDIX family phosphoesterase